ncbi:hypothetical protein HPB49_004879 [Dermacentor silvarum]|uniref:Uncharacterized protein n=1 Tax=Dermacentor silvarum TaxID=543639 RepID=A0ACB8D354_DERSI|nr:hypothetical protein HPB49_004879 [Dermacentor silvarum]
MLGCCAASARVTRGSAKRWLIGTWWLAVFVLAAGFTGHMKASLTMKDPRARYDTLQDIMQSKDVLPVIIRGTTYEERFRVRVSNTHRIRLLLCFLVDSVHCFRKRTLRKRTQGQAPT